MAGDIVFMRAPRNDTAIGICAWERAVKQCVVVDLQMAVDSRRRPNRRHAKLRAGAKRVIEFLGASDFQLAEILPERMAEPVREAFPVTWVRVILSEQGALRGAPDAGVIVDCGPRATGPGGA